MVSWLHWVVLRSYSAAGYSQSSNLAVYIVQTDDKQKAVNFLDIIHFLFFSTNLVHCVWNGRTTSRDLRSEDEKRIQLSCDNW